MPRFVAVKPTRDIKASHFSPLRALRIFRRAIALFWQLGCFRSMKFFPIHRAEASLQDNISVVSGAVMNAESVANLAQLVTFFVTSCSLKLHSLHRIFPAKKMQDSYHTSLTSSRPETLTLEKGVRCLEMNSDHLQ